MAAGPEYSHRFTVLEGCYRKNVDTCSNSDMDDPESIEGMKHMNAAKPPRHISGMRHCSSSLHLAASELELEMGGITLNTTKQVKEGFSPVFRSGSCSEIGPKSYMEDEHICIDNLLDHVHIMADFALPGAFYGVFDGHGGTDAASFIRRNLLQFIVEDNHFPTSLEKAIKSAFVRADYALADSHSLDSSSGTTALTAFIFGSKMHIANVGDCRAVLSKRGKAIVLSRDHKADCVIEKHRIEKLGGKVFDGYLNGQLSVARALGDWHMKGLKGSSCPLSGEPEMREMILTKEDEFLIIACDGLWDVMTSQWAVSKVRKELMLHNDPERCCRELVLEALRRDTSDNLTVIIVCFSSEPPLRIEMPTSRFRRSISAAGLNRLKGLMDGDV